MGDKDILVNKIFALGARRISKDANVFAFGQSREEVDNNDIETLADQYELGPYHSDLSFQGGTSGELENRMLKALNDAATALPLTLFMQTGVAGEVALQQKVKIANFRPTGDWGQLKGFNMKLVPQGEKFELGAVMFNSVGTAGITAPVNGAGVELGALGAGQELLLFYHVVDPPGVTGTTPTLDAELQSDVDDNWLGPTTRISLDQATEPGWQIKTLDGDTTPVTDTWWRLAFTAVGGTGSPTFFVIAAAVIRTK